MWISCGVVGIERGGLGGFFLFFSFLFLWYPLAVCYNIFMISLVIFDIVWYRYGYRDSYHPFHTHFHIIVIVVVLSLFPFSPVYSTVRIMIYHGRTARMDLADLQFGIMPHVS